jgi:hypothetical protein
MQLAVNFNAAFDSVARQWVPPMEVDWPGAPSLFSVASAHGLAEIVEVLFWSPAYGWVALCPVLRGVPGRLEVTPQDLMAVRERVAAGWAESQALAAVLGARRRVG